MNIQQLNEFCQKKFKASIRKNSWSDRGYYFVEIILPNGLKAEANEIIDTSKPKGYYKEHTLQLAVDQAAEMLSIATISVSEKKIESQSYFPDTNKGRAAFRKCMASAIAEGMIPLAQANTILYTPFNNLKEAENLAGQLKFAEKMTLEDILSSGKKQQNSFGSFLQGAGWTKEHGQLASKKTD